MRVHGLCYRDLHLPVLAAAAFHEVTAENDKVEGVDIQRRIASFTEAQRQVYEHIIASINDDERQSRFFFRDGPGGTGKTYLYNTLIASLRKQNKCVLSYVTTGIAADLLIGGRTVHSGFKLPVPSTFHMRIPSESSEKLKQDHLLIIDEASMLSMGAIDLLLRQIMNSPRPFGGKVLLLGRDFRQTAPVVPRGSNAAITESSIKQSPLWYFVTKLSLTENMRIAGQADFKKWLLEVENGNLSNNEELEENLREIPQNMEFTNNIVREVLGEELLLDNDEAVERVSPTIILTPKNKNCLHINTDIMSLLPDFFIHRKIFSGSKRREVTFIPSINLCPSETTLPFSMSRRQFPVVPAFAITINKSQGQSFNNVGIILPSPIFSHGQLYVALSRSRSSNNIKMSVKDHPKQGELIGVAVVRYGAGILKWTEEELKEMDRKSRKLLTMHGSHHPCVDTDRLYMKRANGGKGTDKCGRLRVYRTRELNETPSPK
uniref:ATP-dependent DNA helicase n=1 Tax=Octopus bimaculoides TaxID=37653 RepID=A0A0L8G2V3_OCTBM